MRGSSQLEANRSTFASVWAIIVYVSLVATLKLTTETVISLR